MTPTVSASTGGTTVSLVPRARPAARPATSSVPEGGPPIRLAGLGGVARGGASGDVRRSAGRAFGQRLFRSSATEDRNRAIATTSLLALPGCLEKRRFAAITEATAARDVAPVP